MRSVGRAAAASKVLQSLTAAEAETALLEALQRGMPQEDVLQLADALEGLRGDAGVPQAAQGLWDLKFTSSSKFDLEYPLGRRVDGTAPGLEAVLPKILGAMGSGGSGASAGAASSSPIQRFITDTFRSTQEITADRVDTVVRLGDAGMIRLSAAASVDTGRPQRLNFTFDLGYLEVYSVRIPYPVPFKLLGDEANGWIETTYVSDRVRISRGNKGTVFILSRL